MHSGVPVIDVSVLAGDPAGAEGDRVAASIALACREWGFFQIVGHGIPATTLEQLEQAMRELFALSAREKDAIRRNAENVWGYYDRELTKNTPDWKEIFDFVRVPEPALPDDHPRNRVIGGHNRWPAGRPALRAALLAYLDACETLAFRLLRAVCRGLGLADDRLEGHFRPRHTSFLRLNHYPVCDDPAPPDAPDAPSHGHLGVNRHTDAGALTLLVQSGGEALQVKHGGAWRSVELVPEAFVVNTGDMLQVWSNERCRAPLHRVLASRERRRYSAPFFFNPSEESVCEPLPELVETGREAIYRPVPWGDFRRARAAGDYADLGDEIQISRFRKDSLRKD